MDDIDRFLREDLGDLATTAGDITSRAVAAGVSARARIVARKASVLAGLEETQAVFRHLGVTVRPLRPEGVDLTPGEVVLELSGPADAVLAGERLALNFLMRMSGIATLTRQVVQRVAKVNAKCEIAATRKTTPGFRQYEKRAVEIGGGYPHRRGLFDAILVKDNHLAIAGSPRRAVELARKNAAGHRVEVEAQDVQMALEAAESGADEVLLDNLAPKEARAAFDKLKARFPKLVVEVSGGITPENALDYAFADRMSLGYLTHSAAAADFSLDIERA